MQLYYRGHHINDVRSEGRFVRGLVKMVADDGCPKGACLPACLPACCRLLPGYKPVRHRGAPDLLRHSNATGMLVLQ